MVGQPLQELMEAHGLKFITSVPIPKTMIDHGTTDLRYKTTVMNFRALGM